MAEKAKLVYLAGPVRAFGRSAATDLRKPLEVYFLKRDMVTFNPPGAWCGNFSDACEETVKEGNDMVLLMSQIVATIFIPGVESLGTDAEIRLAAQNRIDIIVVVHDREEVSDAMAWAGPLVGSSVQMGSTQVEYAVLKGTKLDTITTVHYKPIAEVAA